MARPGRHGRRGNVAARPPVALRPSTSMRATARVAAAQRAHSIVLHTPTASYARLRSFHAAAASPRASTGASLAPRGRAAAQCNAGPALYGESWEPAKFLEEGKGEEEEDVAAYGRMQAGGGALLVIKGLEEPLQANQVSRCYRCLQYLQRQIPGLRLSPAVRSGSSGRRVLRRLLQKYSQRIVLAPRGALMTLMCSGPAEPYVTSASGGVCSQDNAGGECGCCDA